MGMSGWHRGAVKPDLPDPQPSFVKRKPPGQSKRDLFASSFIPFLQAECWLLGESPAPLLQKAAICAFFGSIP